MSDTEDYARYFPIETKIGVGIPMENNELFRDWAIVQDLQEDMITLQLSRDQLPRGVNLVGGSILELRVGMDNKGYRCSGYFVSKEEDGHILVHLTGQVASSELREFYRIDLFLPLRYEVPQDQNMDHMLLEWRRRRQQRQADEQERRDAFAQRKKDLIFRAAAGEFEGEEDQERRTALVNEEFNPIDSSWDNEMAQVLNISAGGFKYITTDNLDMDTLMYAEILLPVNPPRIMDSVARVVFKNRNLGFKDGLDHYNIATRFLFIDERDRDAIVKHISNVETLRIRAQRLITKIDDGKRSKPFISPGLFLLAVLVVIAALAGFYYFYTNIGRPHNEIQDTFQEGVRKYIERFGGKY